MKIRNDKIQLILETINTFLSNLDSNNDGWIESEELAEGLMRVLRRAELPWYARLTLQKPLVVLLIDRVSALIPSSKGVKVLQNADSVKKAAKKEEKPAKKEENPTEEVPKMVNPLQSLTSETFLKEALEANRRHLRQLLNNN